MHEQKVEEQFLSGGSQLIGSPACKPTNPSLPPLKKDSKAILIVKRYPDSSSQTPRFTTFTHAWTKLKLTLTLKAAIWTTIPFSLEKSSPKNCFLDSTEPSITAVTFSDGIAQGVAVSLNRLGVRVPQDIEVLGFDRIDRIPQTSDFPIEVPVKEMTGKLIEVLKTVAQLVASAFGEIASSTRIILGRRFFSFFFKKIKFFVIFFLRLPLLTFELLKLLPFPND